MFLIFINDLPLVLENTIISTDLYTDDTTVYDIQTYMQTLERTLQNSFLLLNKWCRENGMVINTDKTKVKLITSRQKWYNLKNNDLSLNFKDADLKLTSNEKVSGVHIDENSLLNGHFPYISKKISSHL